MAKPTDYQLAVLLDEWADCGFREFEPLKITREQDGRFTLTAQWYTDGGSGIFAGSACTFAGAVAALLAELRRAGVAS